MSQKYIKMQNKNRDSAAFGKYFATAVYDKKFVETDELASFIQQQASVKKSDIGAVLDELGEAMKHYFELGQKVRIKGLGIFKVGFSSIGVTKAEDVSAATITDRRVLFQPETERVIVGQEKKDGKVKQKYIVAKHLIKDVVFEETHDNAMNTERIIVGQEKKDGKVKQKYIVAKHLIKDVVFEETHDNAMNVEPEP